MKGWLYNGWASILHRFFKLFLDSDLKTVMGNTLKSNFMIYRFPGESLQQNGFGRPPCFGVSLRVCFYFKTHKTRGLFISTHHGYPTVCKETSLRDDGMV